MNRLLCIAAACALAIPTATAQQTTATVDLFRALTSTKEGQRAIARMGAEWDPKVASIAARRAGLAAERAQLDREKKTSLGWWPWTRARKRRQRVRKGLAIEKEAKALTREEDDDRTAVENERTRVLNQLGSHMTAILTRIAKERGYAVILDSRRNETPVLVTVNDITDDAVSAYDQTYTVP